MITQEEEWRPVPGFDGYEVSSLGRVMSYRRGTARELKGGTTEDGYRFVNLRREGRSLSPKVHVLVAAAFIGPRPEGLEVRHGDGNQMNNSVDNLSYGTRSQNTLDQVAHGTHAQARKTHCKRGHEFTPDNTADNGLGGRACRACARERYQRRMFAAANIQTTEVAA